MFDRPGASKLKKEEVKKNIPLKMFLYAESPEQERNTLSHLTEAFGLVFPNCTATFCSEEQFGVMERGWGGLQKKLFGGQVGEKEGDKGGTSRGQVGEA